MASYVFISSWSKEETLPEGFGVGQYEFNTRTGELKLVRMVDDSNRLSVLHLDKKRNILYVVEEGVDLPAMRCGGGGSVYAFQLDPATGESRRISCVPTFCTNPAYLSLDQTGKYLVVAHHATHSYITKIGKDESGTYHPIVEFDDSLVELFAVNEDGTIGKLLDVAKHTGHGPREKQKNPHPHCAVMSPSGNLFAVCDKGNDGVYLYKIDRENNKIAACGPPYMTPPGTMPRYCVFHPTLPYFYCNCEGAAEVLAFRYDEAGHLDLLGTFGALTPENAPPAGVHYGQQAICMHSSGRFLYDIICDAEVVAVYQIDQEDGSLTLIQNQPIGYGWSRGVTLSPDGRFLLAMCCRGNKTVVFSVGADGKLGPTGHEYHHTAAADAVFWEPCVEGGA